MKYPILLEKLTPEQCVRAVCEKCHVERDWDPAEGDPYDLCIKHEGKLPNGCGGQIVMKYDWGQKCKGCGAMAYRMPSMLAGCCSRKCMLQAEYAATLEANRV